ncbi:MAG: hypothetical protein WC535_06310 [Candidatus Cloacimonas sp.]|jgi:hypothetical protein
MFKYGISYYTVENGERKPESGIDVRLLRPGADWQTGIPLIETGDTGYYECFIEDEKDCGFYEIWDNRNDPNGSFSGKYCTIGKLDARGLQNRCIYSNHIEDGAVTASKIAQHSITASHLDNSTFKLNKLQHEIQNEYRGVGDRTQSSPARIRDDQMITHVLDKEYDEPPHLILTNMCNAHLYIDSIKVDKGIVTISIAIGTVFEGEDAKYQILALATDKP